MTTQPHSRFDAMIARANALSDAELRARDVLIEGHYWLVGMIVNRSFCTNYPTSPAIEYGDLRQAGMVGLVDAAARFKPSEDVKFKTYATFRIRGEVLDLLREFDIIPRSLRGRLNAYERGVLELIERTHRSPSLRELALYLEVSLGKLEDDLRLVPKLFSINQVDEGGSYTLDFEWKGQGPDEQVSWEEASDLVREAMSILDDRERRAVRLYYHEGLTMEQVGRVAGCSMSMISQLHARAMHKLKMWFRIRGYLEVSQLVVGI